MSPCHLYVTAMATFSDIAIHIDLNLNFFTIMENSFTSFKRKKKTPTPRAVQQIWSPDIFKCLAHSSITLFEAVWIVFIILSCSFLWSIRQCRIYFNNILTIILVKGSTMVFQTSSIDIYYIWLIVFICININHDKLIIFDCNYSVLLFLVCTYSRKCVFHSENTNYTVSVGRRWRKR